MTALDRRAVEAERARRGKGGGRSRESGLTGVEIIMDASRRCRFDSPLFEVELPYYARCGAPCVFGVLSQGASSSTSYSSPSRQRGFATGLNIIAARAKARELGAEEQSVV